MRRNNFFAFALAACSGASNAWATETAGYALTIERDTSALRIDTAPIATSRERIGITLEEIYPPHIVLGLTLGQVFISQPRFPDVGGTDASGYFFRLGANYTAYASQPLRLTVNGGYAYEHANSSDVDTETFRLHSWSVGVTLLGALTPWLTAGVGGDVVSISGTERTASPQRVNHDVESAADRGAHAVLELNVESGGYVGMSAGSGVDRGFTIYFARRLR